MLSAKRGPGRSRTKEKFRMVEPGGKGDNPLGRIGGSHGGSPSATVVITKNYWPKRSTIGDQRKGRGGPERDGKTLNQKKKSPDVPWHKVPYLPRRSTRESVVDNRGRLPGAGRGGRQRFRQGLSEINH